MSKLSIDDIPIRISLVSFNGLTVGYQVTLPSGIAKRFYFEYDKDVTLTLMSNFITDFISRIKNV